MSGIVKIPVDSTFFDNVSNHAKTLKIVAELLKIRNPMTPGDKLFQYL